MEEPGAPDKPHIEKQKEQEYYARQMRDTARKMFHRGEMDEEEFRGACERCHRIHSEGEKP